MNDARRLTARRPALAPVHAVTSLLLLVVWVLATGSLAPGSVLLGAVLAVGVTWCTRAYTGVARSRLRAVPLLSLAVVFLVDVVVANVRVAALVLGPRSRLRPAFFVVPALPASPTARWLLATVISLTPGTVSAAFTEDGGALLVHALDLGDPDAEVARIRRRYQRRLEEAFS